VDLISDKFGLPCVIVQVLSKTTMFDFLSLSNHSAFFANIQFFAQCCIHVMTAIGVANPNPHGQAITNTHTKLMIANCN